MSQNWLPEGPQGEPVSLTVPWLMTVSLGVMSLHWAFAHVQVEVRLLRLKGRKQDRPCASTLHRTMHGGHGVSRRRGPGDKRQCPSSV